jgi:hypothetical protein
MPTTVTETSTAQEIIAASKDLAALSKVFTGLIARIAKQDKAALETVIELANQIMHSAQPFLVKVSKEDHDSLIIH